MCKDITCKDSMCKDSTCNGVGAVSEDVMCQGWEQLGAKIFKGSKISTGSKKVQHNSNAPNHSSQGVGHTCALLVGSRVKDH
jgi:hypothetical protein